ncbi:MAG: type I pullulanase [Ruminococcaceae bacterium]|nr:type I pullulanase [Oscillospiraceae bacterium]
MKKNNTRIVSFLLLFCMLFTLCLSACTPNTTPPDNTDPDQTPGGDTPGNVTPEDEYQLPKEEGYNQLTLYWAGNTNIETADVWIWFGDQPGKGYLFHPCAYGFKTVINVPKDVEQVGFIVRRDCSEPGGTSWGTATKDYDQDRFAIIEGEETFIYLKSGDGSQYSSNDGGKTLTMIKKFALAEMINFHTIRYNLTPKTKLTSIDQVKLYQGDTQLTIKSISSIHTESVNGNIIVEEALDIGKPYTLEIAGYGKKAVVPTAIFDSEEFITNYVYDGDDLGATIQGNDTTFKVWAPTASEVLINLYTDGHTESLIQTVPMVKGERGVWSYTAQGRGHGTYYTYTVTTSVGTQTATDPYARAAGVNGNRSMVVDLSRTNPEGWAADQDFKTGITSYSDAVIWEVHVRDFSNKIASSQYKGKYLAFTERGLVNSAGVPIGVDYLVNLGITHVHLLPVYDYATVDESNPDAAFNWGYDPKNYNVPEGSYSTDPFNGEVRIKEFKQMVQALHAAGIGVIMDVVYNHTYDANSAFNRIVPYYYYRYTSSGANSSASGCGNDTASERYMFGKFMVDSVRYWATEYNLDGFRFDLMGLHDLATMQEVESAVHTVNPEAVIYGEGWTMGSTIDKSPQANQGNISKIKPTGDAIGSVAVFNDAIRDSLKGSVFEKTSQGYISGSATANVGKVKFGIAGGMIAGPGWKVENAMVINYMSAHDNNTLWDKLLLSNPSNTVEERIAMNRLGAAILMISQGTPFMQAGEEMLRTKDGDENSYQSSDEINNINWEALTPDSNEYKTMLYYKGLIAMRRAFAIFRTASQVVVSFEDLGGGKLAVKYDDGQGNVALVLINPTGDAMSYELEGEWKLVADQTAAGTETISTDTGSVSLPGCSICVYVK